MSASHDQRIIHSSEESDWRTPPECYQALSREFCFVVDLAADRANHLTRSWFGPGSTDGEDALAIDWPVVGYDGIGASLSCPVAGFLNMPFSRKKARAYRSGRIQNVAGVWEPHPIDPYLATVYEVETWAKKCWEQSQRGCTIVAVMPFTPQTEWYRKYVLGHTEDFRGWSGHAAQQERRLPHRISFLRPDGSAADNAGVNSVIVVWTPMTGVVGPWQPHSFYWSYR